MGDNWEHYIEIQNIIGNYTQNYPVCVDGEGNTPPEDVGGGGGYDFFLEVTNNPNHPEYEDMINWAKMQWYRDFDINLVNRRLKDSLRSPW